MNNAGDKNSTKITYFTDLKAWQEAHKLVLMIYRATRQFPKEEMFCLISQMRRAVISITSNIAEGFSRQSYKEKVNFYSIAHGSLAELQSQLLIALDIGYLNDRDYREISEQTVLVHKLSNGLIKSSKNRF